MMTPTSRIRGHCAACGKVLDPGELAIFFGTIRVAKENPELGSFGCAYLAGTICKATHLQGEERHAVCKDCWANIKAAHFRRDMEECLPS